MPELPEVETVKSILVKTVLNRTIKKVDILYPRLIQTDLESFKNVIKDKKIVAINRKGKFLVFDLNDYSLIVHLRMEGKFFHLDNLKDNLDKHTSLYFTLDDGTFLFFKDTRKFGVMYLVKKEDTYTTPPLVEVGPEPMEIIDMSYLKKAYSRTNKMIKEALLDQKIMCGLGNIYADETLFRSGINPFKKASTITLEESKNLIINSQAILLEAIKNGGSTIKSYHPAEGMSGLFQNSLKVYGRSGKSCYTCGTKLQKRFVGGRGTTFCPKCQNVPYSIGLTGLVGSGKSTVLNLFKKYGAHTLSLDEEVNKLYKSPSFIKLAGEKYPDIISNGEISRELIKDKFKTDKGFKRKYERFVWSNLRSALNDFLINNTDSITVCEVPLLFDSGFNKLFSFNIGVEMSYENRIEKLKKREGVNFSFQKSLDSSNSYELNKNKLDYIIQNDGTKEDLDKVVSELVKTYR